MTWNPPFRWKIPAFFSNTRLFRAGDEVFSGRIRVFLKWNSLSCGAKLEIAPQVEAIRREIGPTSAQDRSIRAEIVVIHEEVDLFCGAIFELAPQIKAIRAKIALICVKDAIFRGAIFKIAPWIGMTFLKDASIRVVKRMAFEELAAISVVVAGIA